MQHPSPWTGTSLPGEFPGWAWTVLSCIHSPRQRLRAETATVSSWPLHLMPVGVSSYSNNAR